MKHLGLKRFLGKWGILWAFLATVSLSFLNPAEALYQFDDVYGPSGKGGQWMVVQPNYDTAGSVTSKQMKATANFINDRDSAYLLTEPVAPGGEDVNTGPIYTMFLVLPEMGGDRDGLFTVNFNWTPPYQSGSAYTQDVWVDTGNDQGSSPYQVQKDPTPTETSGPSKTYNLTFYKNPSFSSYETVRGNFAFHQNPNVAPSQTLQVPLVIANIHNGPATSANPLNFRSTIRDNVGGTTGGGNIVAHERFNWALLEDETPPTRDWVFVPLSKLPIDSNSVSYRLSTEVVNYTGIRYAIQRYDGYTWVPLAPYRWSFDLPPTGDIPPFVYLNDLSHIPPGLVTTYNQSFNVVSGVKEILRMYPVDPVSGFRNLTLSHRSIFGLDLGTVRETTSNPNSFIVTGFRLLSAGTDFLANVGKAMNVSNVKMPEPADGVLSGSVEYSYIGSDVIASLRTNAGIPMGMTGTNGTGLLPLHITFNLPRSNQLVNPRWSALSEVWQDTGNIRSSFANAFSVYLQDAYGNNMDLFEWLQSVGAYDSTVKVFLDEQRNVITVNLIVMLMDGDGGQAKVRVMEDSTSATSNNYIVVSDGNRNNKWDLKIFAAPKGYVSTDTKTSTGGSGCDAAALGFVSALAFFFCVPAILRRRV